MRREQLEPTRDVPAELRLLDTHGERTGVPQSFDCGDNSAAAFTQIEGRGNDERAGDSVDHFDEGRAQRCQTRKPPPKLPSFSIHSTSMQGSRIPTFHASRADGVPGTNRLGHARSVLRLRGFIRVAESIAALPQCFFQDREHELVLEARRTSLELDQRREPEHVYRVSTDLDPSRRWKESFVVALAFDRTEDIQRSETRLEERVPCAGEDLSGGAHHIGASAVARIEFVYEDVYELRDVLGRSPVHDIEVVRCHRRALSDGGEQPYDDELNVARRQGLEQAF